MAHIVHTSEEHGIDADLVRAAGACRSSIVAPSLSPAKRPFADRALIRAAAARDRSLMEM
ncbi:hypothetical protein HS048_00780 [Planomonospora sp. ID91781]|uniref:hypothetical protein n=1 Tax=Planomonospora sp. ID91781 TaxID=2738135 RepID=UPI0018C44C23|nr:hypothetical protein [Planomonospora sp. ID91781]MBG0819299.1 hypothetical protein [Planomonospora sp. ID91781]